MAAAQEVNEGAGRPSQWKPVPWATFAATLGALAVFLSPTSLAEALVYDRAAILGGEWWRAFTGQWVHFSASHLFWNLLIVVPAGVWAERLEPRRARALFLVAPVLIGATLMECVPDLIRYAGLSGVAAAMLAFLAAAQLKAGTKDRWFWVVVLVVLGLKIAAELLLTTPVLTKVPDSAIRSVPLAHVAGVVAALLVLNFRRRRAKR